MSKLSKKLIGGIITLGLLLLIIACSSEENMTENQSEQDILDGDLEPITFSFFAADTNQDWNGMDTEIGQVILQQTGVTLEGDFALGDPAERISLFAASGDYPHFVLPKGDGNLLVEAGAMIDLRPLIEEHAPNIQKVYGDYLNRMQWSEDDDSIYFLGTYPVDQQNWEPGHSFWLQHEVVKELGYPEINTVDDFENAIKEYYEMHPEIDGQPTIPLTLLADDWRILISVTNPAGWTTGAPDDGEWFIDEKTHEAMLRYRRPEEREYFRWLNHMNAEGLLDPESFVQQEDQYKSKIGSGRVLGLIDADWSISESQTALREAGKYERMYGVYPVTLDESFEPRNFQDNGYIPSWGIGITVDNPDPVRAIQFLDWMASEEAQILNNWGIEDVHYQLNEEGVRYLSSEQRQERLSDSSFRKRTGIDMYKAYGPHYGDGVLDSTGQPFTINSREELREDYTEIEKEVLDAYGVEIWGDLFPDGDQFPVKPWGVAWEINWDASSPINVPFQQIQDTMYTRIPEAILTEPGNFDSVYDRFMDEIEAHGVYEMEEHFTELIKKRVELWSD